MSDSNTDLSGLKKSRYQHGCIPSGDCFLAFVSFLRPPVFLSSWPPFFEVSKSGFSPSHLASLISHISSIVTSLSFSLCVSLITAGKYSLLLMTHGIRSGHNWLTQKNLFILRSVKLITPAKSLSPCKVPIIRTWTSLVCHYSTCDNLNMWFHLFFPGKPQGKCIHYQLLYNKLPQK